MTEFPTERWTHIGRRVVAGGKLGSFFLDADGQEAAFVLKRAPHVVGGVYDMPVERKSGGVSIQSSHARYVERSEDPRVPEWEAEDRAAYAEDELRKLEQRHRREGTFGTLTLDQVRVQMNKAVGGRRVALLAAVLQYVGGPAR